MLEIAIDAAVEVATLLWPSRDRTAPEQHDHDRIAVLFGEPGALTRGLNESGWLADDVLAAGALRQGKPPSVCTAVTGLACIELARRRSKSLPREFVLAATAGHVVAFGISARDSETSTPVVEIKRGELGRWPRELVGLSDVKKALFSRGATLTLAGERFPVTSDGDDSTEELIALLRR
jgi:hypothetical protein